MICISCSSAFPVHFTCFSNAFLMLFYVFFIDFVGHIEDQAVTKVLDELSADVADLKVLGSYPRAVL